MRRYLSGNLLLANIGERRKPRGIEFGNFCRGVKEVSRVNRKIPMRSNANRFFFFLFR